MNQHSTPTTPSDRLSEREAREFLTFAALTYPLRRRPPAPLAAAPNTPAGDVHQGLVIQGDVAFWPLPALAATAARDWTCTAMPARVSAAGGRGGHAHWLIPSGPGVGWVPTGRPGPYVIVPDGLTVRAHHSADPIEHEDLVLGPGVWSIRVQTITVPTLNGRRQVAAERPYWWAKFPRSSAGWDGLDIAGCW